MHDLVTSSRVQFHWLRADCNTPINSRHSHAIDSRHFIYIHRYLYCIQTAILPSTVDTSGTLNSTIPYHTTATPLTPDTSSTYIGTCTVYRLQYSHQQSTLPCHRLQTLHLHTSVPVLCAKQKMKNKCIKWNSKNCCRRTGNVIWQNVVIRSNWLMISTFS